MESQFLGGDRNYSPDFWSPKWDVYQPQEIESNDLPDAINMLMSVEINEDAIMNAAEQVVEKYERFRDFKGVI